MGEIESSDPRFNTNPIDAGKGRRIRPAEWLPVDYTAKYFRIPFKPKTQTQARVRNIQPAVLYAGQVDIIMRVRFGSGYPAQIKALARLSPQRLRPRFVLPRGEAGGSRLV